MRSVTKIDLFREHRDEYAMPKEPALVRVGTGKYLTVEGRGGPDAPEFRTKLGGLYGAAYTLKFALKKTGRDFKVGVLEGLWTAPGGKTAFTTPKETWRWKLLIRVPAFVRAPALRAALAELRAKRGAAPEVRLESIREGKAVQVLHVGAYGDEPATLTRMDAFARERGLRFRGAHHEIYLSDPRRVPPSRLRTILRLPVA